MLETGDGSLETGVGSVDTVSSPNSRLPSPIFRLSGPMIASWIPLEGLELGSPQQSTLPRWWRRAFYRYRSGHLRPGATRRLAGRMTLVNHVPKRSMSDRRSILAALALAAGLLTAGCSRNDAAPPPAHSVSYVLEWKKTKVEQGSAGGAWELTNDLGYRVGLTRGYVVTRSLELIPCNPVPPISLLHRLGDFIGPRPAYAGHSAIADPSATKAAEVESLLDTQPHPAGTLPLGPQKYCQAHYLIARAEPSANGLPVEVDLVDQSVRLEGWFRPPGIEEQTPFAVATGIANGKLFELPRRQGQPSLALDTATASAVILVRRDLDSIFDHVDFAKMDAKRIGREVLANLINNAEIELQLKPDGAAT